MVLELRPGRNPFLALASRMFATAEVSPISVSAQTVETMPLVSRKAPPSAPGGIDVAEANLQFVDEMVSQLIEEPHQLNLRLHQLADQDGRRVLLYVDQLEELFSQVPEPKTRLAFMEAICTAVSDPSDHVRVIFTLRDDFLGRIAESESVREALRSVTVLRCPDTHDLARILTRPLEAVGYSYDDDSLVRQIIDEVAGEATALPLLQFACETLWRRRDQGTRKLLSAVYREMGGVAGALADHADGVLDGMVPENCALARAIFLRLITPAGTRRVLGRAQLLEGLSSRSADVANQLIQARLISQRKTRAEAAGPLESEVELVHESLIQRWGRLRRWVDESREERVFVGELRQAAELWDRRGRKSDELWGKAALEEARFAIRRYVPLLDPLQQGFLSQGHAHISRRRRFRRVGLVLALVALAGAAGVFALKEREATRARHAAQRERSIADTRRAEAERESAGSAYARDRLLEARARLRMALETTDSTEARLLWWKLEDDDRVWNTRLPNTIYSADFSPDGSQIAVASQRPVIHLVDVQTTVETTLRCGSDDLQSVRYSRDGKLLAAGDSIGQVWLWSLPAHQVQRLSPAMNGPVEGLAFSADGSRLAASSWSGRVQIWRLPADGLLHGIKAHEGKAYGVAFSPDGRWFASSGYDKRIRLFAINGGLKPILALHGHQRPVYALRFAPDSRTLVSTSFDGRVGLWRVPDGGNVGYLAGPRGGPASALDLDGAGTLATAAVGRDVGLWDLPGRRLLQVFSGHTDLVLAAAITRQGTLIASGGVDQQLRLWRIGSQGKIRRSAAQRRSAADHADFSADGRKIIVAGYDGVIRILDAASGRSVRGLTGHSGAVLGLAAARQAQVFASAGVDNTIRLWDLSTGETRTTFIGHRGVVRSVALTADGTILASGSVDDTARLWDATTGQLLRTFVGHKAGVYGVALSPDGSKLATGSADRTVRVWRVSDGRSLFVLSGHQATVGRVAFSPAGDLLVSASYDGTARIWDSRTGGSRHVLPHGKVRVQGLAISPDGQRLGTTNSDGTVRIWDMRTVRTIHTLRGHEGEANGIAFSADGKLVVTVGDDTTVRLWRTSDGRPVWEGLGILGSPTRILTHRGWIDPLTDQLDLAFAKAAGARFPSNAIDILRIRANDSFRCTLQRNGTVEGFDLTLHRRRFVLSLADRPDDVVPLRSSCLVQRGALVTQHFGPDDVRTIARRAQSIMPTDQGAVVVVDDGRALLLDREGATTRTHAGLRGASRLATVGQKTILGFSDGSFEVHDASRAATVPTRPLFSLAEVPASRPTIIRPGPTGIVIVGFASGELGFWSTQSGTPLLKQWLHGPIKDVRVDGGQLVALSELGDYLVLDLSVFQEDYCALLRRIWREVPVIWSQGRARREPLPLGHRCAEQTR
jgi:WD40 repeat protein